MIGTRPEAIKMAPVILALRRTEWADVRICATAQHREMLDEALAIFGIEPDTDLDAMRPNQGLSNLTARLLNGIDRILADDQPDAVLAQGDTTTVLSTALACFYRHIPFAHIEAGLRTGDLRQPFPEEMNRVIAGHLASLHFAPTLQAQSNLLAEGTSPESVYITGNTVIDALLWIAAKRPAHGLPLPAGKRLVLLTVHRRENFGTPMREVFQAVLTLTQLYPDVHFIYPVHPNPNVKGLAYEVLGNNPSISLCPPLDYLRMVGLLQAVEFVLTDSGGIQEEAPALGKPVLILRNETERPEAVVAGVARLVGTCCGAIVTAASELLTDRDAYQRMAKGLSPYGDGHAASRIVELLKALCYKADECSGQAEPVRIFVCPRS